MNATDRAALDAAPNFDAALKVVLAHEGGYVDDPADPGGATNFGVSLRWLRTLTDLDNDGWLDGDLDKDGDVDADDIRRLTPEVAGAFYREQWWDKYQYGILPGFVAVKTFDLAINMGAKRAHQKLQRAIRAASGRDLADDGVLGDKTRRAVREIVDGNITALPLVTAMRSEAAGFYRGLVWARDTRRKAEPDLPSFGKFLGGWLKRAYF